ncbi:MAG: HPr family phosphocarrier protein [Faecalimonas umbilicata]|uniref:HPr family phosphocarrier protein n=1 Tax=Faecalimonas umbilicata TaxID=1912855 RepID=UPI00205E273E|nr:MAG TPA: Catabolite control protein A [Caudoviricetes sp.]
MKIKLNKITDINYFSSSCSKYYSEEIMATQGRQVVDAKSLLGLYSLDLLRPIDVVIETDDKDVENNFYDFISKWEVDEV